LNESGQELDSDNQPNVVQTYFVKKIAQAKFNSWVEVNFYPVENKKSNTNRECKILEQNFDEEEDILISNLNYEIETVG